MVSSRLEYVSLLVPCPSLVLFEYSREDFKSPQSIEKSLSLSAEIIRLLEISKQRSVCYIKFYNKEQNEQPCH